MSDYRFSIEQIELDYLLDALYAREFPTRPTRAMRKKSGGRTVDLATVLKLQEWYYLRLDDYDRRVDVKTV